MTFRDKTYYDRNLLLTTKIGEFFSGSISNNIIKAFTDISGNFYTLETYYNVVPILNVAYGIAMRKSSDYGNTWTVIKNIRASGTSFVSFGAGSDKSGSLFLAYSSFTGSAGTGSLPTVFVERSLDFGNSWSVVLANSSTISLSTQNNAPSFSLFDISKNSSNEDHVGFAVNAAGINGTFVYTTNHGSTWQSASISAARNMIFSKLSASIYYTFGISSDAIVWSAGIASASFNGSNAYNAFGNVFVDNANGPVILCDALATNSSGVFYAIEYSASLGIATPIDTILFLSSTNGRTFTVNRRITTSGSNLDDKLFFDNTGKLYHTANTGSGYFVEYSTVGSTWNQWTNNEKVSFFDSNTYGGPLKLPQFFMIKDLNSTSQLYLVSNNTTSASLGPTMLATSFGYTAINAPPGNSNTLFKLNNVSEFPHSNGIFQMKNIVLGTTVSGKIGSTEDSIVQVKHIGSVVKVMWPQQDSISKPIKGFGDFSAGERAGKLSTIFQPGAEMDVAEFDHVCLYGYVSKETSGTLDDIIISIERKPTNDNAFTTDQAVSYSLSGSKTEARLTDIEYKKQIDYGDLSISKIGFPIDIPLTNTKIMRVSARHRLGQSDDVNKNLIIWGRFILSSKDTQET